MAPHRSTSVALSARLTRLAAGLTAAACLSACGGSIHAEHGVRNRNVRFDKLPFRVVNIDLARANLALYWHKPGTHKAFGSIDTLRQWGKQHGRRLLFAANAGIYDAKRAPLGLYVENGNTLVPLNTAHGDPAAGNFSLLPNGVFAINTQGKASIQTTTAFKRHRNDPQWATQSGPMLVIDGKLNPHFKAHSDSLKWRSGVCARTPTQVVFAISEAPVNFHTFARLFRDKLGCRNALYLDGTLSQFFVDGQFYGPPSFMVKPYAGMFAVFAEKP